MQNSIFFLSAVALAVAVSAGASPLSDLVPEPQRVEARSGAASAAALRNVTERTGSVPGAPEGVADEAYVLEVSPEAVTVTAGARAGRLNARKTLDQLVKLSDGRVPCCRIVDWPLVKWRGFMLDTARNYLDVESLRDLIDVMAAYKLNLFHWHITEYYGWRLASKKYPQLQEKGYHDPCGTRNPGKFYTQEEFRALVDYAYERGVTVMPEFDVPGHALAFRKAFGFKTMSDPGVKEILTDLFAELCGLAPKEKMPFVHMGGDEVWDPKEVIEEATMSAWAKAVADSGRTVVSWNPGQKFTTTGPRVAMIWGKPSYETDAPMFDARGWYIEEYEPFELLCAAAFSRPFRTDRPDPRQIGAIFCGWHDSAAGLPYRRSLAQQQALPACLLLGDNFWHGRDYVEEFTRRKLPLPSDPRFALAADIERRVAVQRDKVLDKPGHAFHFVRQTQMRWRLSDEKGTVFARDVPQASVFPYYGEGLPQNRYHSPTGTVIAETWIKSPDDREIGAWIGFTGYDRDNGRQRTKGTPPLGQWNKFGATIELNGSAIPPPRWEQPDRPMGPWLKEVKYVCELDEIPYANDEYYMREPTRVRLRKGWNHVRMTLPMTVRTDTWRTPRWVGTFVPVAGTTAHPREVADLEYASAPPNVSGRKFRVGENVILNPGFVTRNRTGVPEGWSAFSGKPSIASREEHGGPGGAPSMKLVSSRNPSVRKFDFRLGRLGLPVGGRFRLSCWVRAKDFRARKRGFQVASTGWGAGLNLPIREGTYGWTRFSDDLTLKAVSKDGLYFAVFYAEEFDGEVEFAAPEVAALDGKTAEAVKVPDWHLILREPRLVPVDPLLSAIPRTDRRVFFEFYGDLEHPDDEYRVRLEIGDRKTFAPLTRRRMSVRLPDGPDEGRFTAFVEWKKGEKDGVEFERAYAYRVVDLPKPTEGTRLNNGVTEFVNRSLKPGGSGAFPLSFDRDTWLYLSGDADEIAIDGRPAVTPEMPGHEAFRRVSLGTHRLSVRNARGGRLIVRRIPEIYNYQTGDRALQRELVFASTTTIGHSKIHPEDETMLRATGHLRLNSVPTTTVTNKDDFLSRLVGCAGLAKPGWNGVMLDEQGSWLVRGMDGVAKGLWEYGDPPEGRPVYSWLHNEPYYLPTDRDMVAAGVNATGGRGRVLYEYYCRTQPTEREAAAYIRDFIQRERDAFAAHSKSACASWGYILGTYVNSGYAGVAPHCEVDYRYYLDMQYHYLATTKDLDDLPCVGVWGSAYADEELNRWTFMLQRHYFIEGKREMLSKAYGLAYLPGHLTNGDFAEGLAHWTPSGAVTVETVADFGKNGEYRQDSDVKSVGDTFAAFVRRAGAPATLRQTVIGLKPGKTYLLAYKTFRTADARQPRFDRRPNGLTARIEGGDPVPSRGYVRANPGSPGPKSVGVTNNRQAFVARSETADIVFTAEACAEGESVGVNCISLTMSILPPF